MTHPEGPSSRPWLGPLMLIGAVVLAYHNSFGVPFLLDDHASIVENPTIRRLGPASFSPPVGDGYTVGGRPLLNFTLAVNHAISGTAVWSYHAFNLLVHGLAALVLLGVLRHTFIRAPLASGDNRSGWIPLGVSLLWALHPLQTGSVTYIVQRAESMVSLFYLLTLYFFIRGTEAAGGRGWFALSVAACLLGVMTKEVIVTAPLLVLLYDRTFVAGSVRAAWRARHQYYLPLFCTWIVLAGLVVGTAGRGGSVGAGGAISPLVYALTQCAAMVLYLRLVVWPSPLIFDYGTEVVRSVGDVWLQLILIGALGLAAVVALRRRSPAGFLGASFFLLLAPSSSVVPIITQTMSEHRMYLALAPVLVLGVVAAHRWLGPGAFIGTVALAAGAGTLTVLRNLDYQTEFSIWQDTAEKRPNNARAQNEYGKHLFLLNRFAEALPVFQRAVRLAPSESEAYHFNLALTFARLNRPAEALPHYREAVRLRSNDPESQVKLAVALGEAGQLGEAAGHFEAAVRLRPDQAEARWRWAVLLHAAGQTPAAIARLEDAVRVQPDYWPAWNQLGLCLAALGRHDAAIESYRQALRFKPGSGSVLFNLGESWFAKRDYAQAAACYGDALRDDPANAAWHHYRGLALAMGGRTSEAAAEFERAVELRPDYTEASLALARARAELAKPVPR